MKKLLLIAILMLALVVTAVACSDDKPADTTIGETTAAPAPGVTTAEPDADTTAEPAPETTVAPAPETTEAPAPETTEAPAPETTEAPAPETTEAPVDPADPVLMLDAEALNTLAGAAAPNVNQLAGSEVITEGSYTFARLTAAAGGDPYVAIIPLNSDYTLPQYMAISYRTNSTTDGQFFLGSGAGWNGNGDCFNVAWNEGDWNFQVIDLAATGVTSITDGKLTYCRLDFFAGDSAEGDYFDVEYIGFFNTADYANEYNSEKHPAFVEKEEAGMKNHSFDTFYVNGAMYFPEDGGASDKLDAINNTVTFGIDEAHDSMLLRGWIGFDQAIEAFGYYIDDPYAQIFGEFKTATEDGVKAAGGEHATRFEILVPLAELERGTHTVGFVVKLADGTVARLRSEITVVIPTNYDNYTVPQDQWVISGHCPQLVGKEGHANSGMVAAGGVESGALLHQGSIYLGELDLSKYSKVVVMWGCDNSGVTQGHYDANANNRIMLLNAVMDGVMSPAEETIIAGGTYELGGWAVQAFEIDLTNVSYNGPVYVAIDALPGTFALFASVEFIGAEITDEPAPVTSIAVDGDFADWADKAVTEIPVSKFIAWTGSAPENFTLKTSFSSDGEYLYVYLNPGENSGVTMYQICLITDNTVASDAAQAWYNVTFADGVASIAGVTGACKGEAKVSMTGTEVEAAIPIAAIYGEGFALPVETRVLLVAQINGGTHMGTFHDGKNPNDDSWADRTGDGCPLTLNADGTYTFDLPQTEEPEEPEEPEAPKAEVKHTSNDELRIMGTDNVTQIGQAFDPGKFDGWNKVLTLEEGSFGALIDWGWSAFVSDTFEYGYIINGVEIFSPAFAFATEQGVLDAAASVGATNASRFYGVCAAAALPVGENNVKFAVKLDGGVVVVIREYTVVITPKAAEPETPAGENYNVPQDKWTVSGHCAQIVGKEGHGNSPMVAAGGIDSGALLHQGAVGVGEIDLSKYNKVIIKYGIDNSQVTIDKHAANGANRIMLSKVDNHMTNAPADADVIASVDYTPTGWALTAIEIDLTAVDYNGPVFITWDTLGGTFMLIGSIEFIA